MDDARKSDSGSVLVIIFAIFALGLLTLVPVVSAVQYFAARQAISSEMAAREAAEAARRQAEISIEAMNQRLNAEKNTAPEEQVSP